MVLSEGVGVARDTPNPGKRLWLIIGVSFSLGFLIEVLEEWKDGGSLSVRERDVASVVGVRPSWVELWSFENLERLVVAEVGAVV